MAAKLSTPAGGAFFFVVVGLALHITGLLTKFWFVTDSSSGESINIGLFQMITRFNNGTEIISDSPISREVDHYVIMAIAGVNALFCLFVYIKNVSVCVGVIAFITSALMCLSVYFTFESANSVKGQILLNHPDWSDLSFSWSFCLLFAGIILNIFSSLVFLTILLIRGERIASKSTKGLGLEDGKKSKIDKTPIVSVIANESFAYENSATEPMPDSAYPGPSNPEILYSERL